MAAKVNLVASAGLAFAVALTSPGSLWAAQACSEVKVMASAGPESDVVAKYANPANPITDARCSGGGKALSCDSI